MTTSTTNMKSIIQPDISQAYHDMHLVAALQSELAKLQAKVETYYQDEVVRRGDQIMMREYCGYFGIESE